MRRNSALAALADIVGIVLFCVIGRRSHAEGLTAAGVAETAWPFLMGTAVGWLAARAWRRPTAVVPTGVVVWLCTIVVGMLARRATSAGVAVSFVIVAMHRERRVAPRTGHHVTKRDRLCGVWDKVLVAYGRR